MHRFKLGFQNTQLRVKTHSQIAARVQENFQPIRRTSPDQISAADLTPPRCYPGFIPHENLRLSLYIVDDACFGANEMLRKLAGPEIRCDCQGNDEKLNR